MSKGLITFLIIIFVIILIVFMTPLGRSMINSWLWNVQKVDDATDYHTIKKVEDTCRSMIASYKSDVLIYEQYVNSDDSEKQSWAEQARMRANKTASTYNNYILENSYVWKGNIPKDIKFELPYI